MRNAKNLLQIVARNVRYYRLHAELSQEKLAELADVHRNYIGRVERCEINLSVLQLGRIALALNVKPADLLKEI